MTRRASPRPSFLNERGRLVVYLIGAMAVLAACRIGGVL